MKLYELASEYQRLIEFGASDAGEGIDLVELSEAVESIEAQLEQKCVGIGKVLATLDAEADAYANEAKRLLDHATRRQKAAEHLREYVRTNMRDRGITKIQGETFAFSLINCPERVEVLDISRVPDAFLRRKVVESVAVDKKAVLAAYKSDGECVEGTEVVRDVRLQIK